MKKRKQFSRLPSENDRATHKWTYTNTNRKGKIFAGKTIGTTGKKGELQIHNVQSENLSTQGQAEQKKLRERANAERGAKKIQKLEK